MSKTDSCFNKKKPGLLTHKQKKITFFSAILLVIGSSIGAGIFLKNGEILRNVHGSVILSLLSWILSITAIICMGISLLEVSSNSPDNNGGLIAWVKRYNNNFLYRVSKNFMAYIYLPINFAIMPLYAVMTLQDAFGWQTSWWVVFLIAFAIALWFICISGLNSKAGDIQNKIIMSVKFIPLVFAIFVGIILMACGQSHFNQPGYNSPGWLPNNDFNDDAHPLVSNIYAGLGVIASIPAIIFSFDGFYAAAGIRTQMAEPEKSGKSLVIGLIIVSILDILISISLLIGSSNGKINGLYWFNEHKAHWVITIIEILIAFGIFGIINGFSLYTTRYYEYLIDEKEIYCPIKYQTKTNPNNPKVGLLYSLIICAPIFLIIILVGAFGYCDASGYGLTKMIHIDGNPAHNLGYDLNSNQHYLDRLYSFTDVLANWSSTLVFACIILPIVGGMIYRKKEKLNSSYYKVKGYTTTSIITTIILLIAVMFIVITSIANIPLVISYHKDIGTNYTQQDWQFQLIGSIVTLVALLVIVAVTTIPAAIKCNWEKQANKIKHK